MNGQSALDEQAGEPGRNEVWGQDLASPLVLPAFPSSHYSLSFPVLPFSLFFYFFHYFILFFSFSFTFSPFLFSPLKQLRKFIPPRGSAYGCAGCAVVQLQEDSLCEGEPLEMSSAQPEQPYAEVWEYSQF